MANKGYTTRVQIEDYLTITIDPAFYSRIDAWIGSIERYIDHRTGRNFVADAAASKRVYDGDGESNLLIDDCVAVTKLEIDETEIDSDDYYLYPENAIAKGIPISQIKLFGARFSRCGLTRQNIWVTAKWGYSTVAPEDIALAATVLVAGIINFSLNSEGEVKSMTVGRYSVSYRDKSEWADYDRANEILDSYEKITV